MGLNFISSDRFCPLFSALPKLEGLPSPPRTVSNRPPRDVETFDEFVGRVVVEVEAVVPLVFEVECVLSTITFCSIVARLSVVNMEDSEVEIGPSSTNVAPLVARMPDDSMVGVLLNFTCSDRFCLSSSTLPKLEGLFSSPLSLSSGSTEEVEMFVGLGCRFVVDAVEDVVVAGTVVEEVPIKAAFCVSFADFFGNATVDSEVDTGALAAIGAFPVSRITDDSLVGCIIPWLFNLVDTMAADSDE